MGHFYDLFVEYAPLFLKASWVTLRLTAAALALALRTTLPVLGNQYIIAVKDSSLVSFIGMTELFQTSRTWPPRHTRS